MDKILTGILAIIFTLTTITGTLIAMLLWMPIVGAVTGFVVQSFFTETTRMFMLWTGLGIEFWQLSAVVAFFGSYFKHPPVTK